MLAAARSEESSDALLARLMRFAFVDGSVSEVACFPVTLVIVVASSSSRLRFLERTTIGAKVAAEPAVRDLFCANQCYATISIHSWT